MQVCTSHQTDNHASTPPLSFFTGRMPFLLPNQQRQSTEGIYWYLVISEYLWSWQICVKLPMSADNMILLTYAAERRP